MTARSPSVGRPPHPVDIGQFQVMQYAEGGTMERLILDQREPFPPNVILNYFTQVLLPLPGHQKLTVPDSDSSQPHAQQVHRSPRSQDTEHPPEQEEDPRHGRCPLAHPFPLQLSDFGISKELSTRSNLAHTVIGTPNYLSPEICEGGDTSRRNRAKFRKGLQPEERHLVAGMYSL